MSRENAGNVAWRIFRAVSLHLPLYDDTLCIDNNTVICRIRYTYSNTC